MTDTKRRYMVLWLSELQGVKFNYWFDLSSAKVEFDGLKTFESVVYAVLVDIQHPEKDVELETYDRYARKSEFELALDMEAQG